MKKKCLRNFLSIVWCSFLSLLENLRYLTYTSQMFLLLQILFMLNIPCFQISSFKTWLTCKLLDTPYYVPRGRAYYGAGFI
jgi:hypothetical protein